MSRLLELSSSDALAQVRGGGAVTPLEAATFDSDRPDVHLVLTDDRGMPFARLSLWARRTPPLADHRTGLIGHYAAADPASGVALLNIACDRLTTAGRTIAIGPIDGDTSRRYRFIIERGSEPIFLFEPDNRADLPAQFTAAGFETIATYRSSLNINLTHIDDRVERARKRLNEQAVSVRSLRPDRFDEELRAIFDLSNAAFSGAFLHTPLDWPTFAAMYEPVRKRIDSRLVLIAERGGAPVGFLFAIRDFNQMVRGLTSDTVIIKTIATLKDRSLAGLGGVLLSDAHQAARELGYRRAIHALMHEDNSAIINLSSRYARPFRRYALFARSLR